MSQYAAVFTEDKLQELFPQTRADEFFEALFGDAEEGSYDIELGYDGDSGDTLHFLLKLRQRPGKCLACNLTYGLPQVFSRHPIININGLAEQAAGAVGKQPADWKLGTTSEHSAQLHVIPLNIKLG